MAVFDSGGDVARHGAGDGGVVAGAVPGFVPWIFAAAEEPGESWWERRRGKREKRSPKRMGEVSQAAFLVKAQRLGFGLALPSGDSEKYDFIVWARPGGRLLRVQVKATGRLNRGGYDVQPVYSTRGEGKKTYTAADIDVLAAHVILEERLEDSRKRGLVFAAGGGVCRGEEFEILSGLEEPMAAVGGVSGGLGVVAGWCEGVNVCPVLRGALLSRTRSQNPHPPREKREEGWGTRPLALATVFEGLPVKIRKTARNR